MSPTWSGMVSPSLLLPLSWSLKDSQDSTPFSSEYQAKKAHSHPDHSSALANLDVLNTILLSLHPASKIKDLDLSDYTREGLAEMQQLQDLIHVDVIKGYDGCGRRLVSTIFL